MTRAQSPSNPTERLIVVGASAGGIEALSILVGSLPADLAAPVVIAQHLDPTRPSHLAEILSRHSVLPVRSVIDLEKLLPGIVYVVPSNRHVEITDHEVRVHSDATRRPTPSVDLLLESAAGIFADRLVAVILTGSGSDGSAGAHVVKEAGGIVLIQDPATAAFPSMPRALASTLVDASVQLEHIGQYLGDILTDATQDDLEGDPDLAALLTRVRENRGIDFSAYKPATIMRRLRRRMTVVGEKTTAGYLAYLDATPDEEEQLVADFLIKVTRFFRDPEIFARLREDVIPELIDNAVANDQELRLWSAGCATGEEAYSLALLVADLLRTRSKRPSVRVFATDLDESALMFARQGAFPKSALADVPRALIAAHFTEREGAYQANKELRGLLVFGRHDLAQRPPFPNTDLVLCRNVLIYFTPELQRRALDIFAYSLRNGGYLVLGKSESVGPGESMFKAIDSKLRIFHREGSRPTLPPARLPSRNQTMTSQRASFSKNPVSLEHALSLSEEETRSASEKGGRSEDLVRRLPIGVVIVDTRYDILTINGAARELLGVYGLAIGQDLIHLAQRIPSTELRAAIDKVFRGDPAQRLADIVTVETATGEECHLSVTCHPDRVSAEKTVESVLVLVEDVTALVLSRIDGEGSVLRAERLGESNRQLLDANRDLSDELDRMRYQMEDLHLVTAAAQVSAEEVETLNEELQSTNEELETLHEEAQASLEELNVANDELQARSVEAQELASSHQSERVRLEAVLMSMADAVIVVDSAGRAVLTNLALDELRDTFGDQLQPADEHGVVLANESMPLVRAARGETFRVEFTMDDRDDIRHWFEATARPLQEDDNGVGVVVIRDISDRSVRRLQGEFLAWAGHELRTPLTALQSYLQMAARRVPPDGDQRLQSYLEKAVGQVKRQATLISELLDATRLETGHLALVMTTIDLAVLAKQAVEVAQVLTTGQSISVGGEKGPFLVSGDSSRLEQVLLNLLTNAIAYAPKSDRIEVNVNRENDTVVLAVRDYGRGIDPAQQDRIFERLVQGVPDESSSTQGLGLGLYIAREIIRHHGGTINVESSLGEGATFSIRLPLTLEDSPVAPKGQ